MADNLWDQAVNSLSVEIRRDIDFLQSDKPKILSDVLEAVEKKKQLCLNGRWRFKRSTGEEVVLRDVIDKIVKWVTKFKEVGDLAIQYDPGHAALPWAVVRFLLQIVVNDSQVLGTILEAIEIISHEITRCTIIEKLYLRRKSNTTVQLREALVKLYTAILRFLMKAKSKLEQKHGMRWLQSGLQVPETIQQSLGEVTDGQVLVDQCMHLADAETLNDLTSGATSVLDVVARLKTILLDLDKPIQRSAVYLEHIHDNLQREERLKIIHWLSTIPHYQHHRNICEGRLADSGSWLLQKPEFLEWRKSSVSSILWLHGIPGCGKSRLVSVVVDHLMEEGSPAPAFFYCARNPAEPQRAQPAEILRSVIRQLACPQADLPVREPVVKKHKEMQIIGEDVKLTLAESVSLALQLTEENPATIIIEALDECSRDSRLELLGALERLIKESRNLVKIFISSRDDVDIAGRLQGTSNLRICAKENSKDIRRFVDEQVEKSIQDRRLLHGNVSVGLKHDIVNELVENARGLFLWVSLQIQSLCDPRFHVERDIRAELGKLPKGLKDLYAKFYEQLLGAEEMIASIAKAALQWLLCAQRPLSPLAFLDAISADFVRRPEDEGLSPDMVPSICCNLVVLDAELNVFRFAHLSVREFLEKRPGYDIHRAHAHVAKTCIQRLLKMSNEKQTSGSANNSQADTQCSSTSDIAWNLSSATCDGSSSLSQTAWQTDGETSFKYTIEPFLFSYFQDYATIFWATHCAACGRDERNGPLLRDMLAQFGLDTWEAASTFQDWVILLKRRFELKRKAGDSDYRRLNHYGPVKDKLLEVESRPLTPFFTACAFGFEELVGWFRMDDVNSKNECKNTGLIIASKFGHFSIAHTLLSMRTNVNARDDDGGTALHCAAKAGCEDISRLLLSCGAIIDVQNYGGETPLHIACKKGHDMVVQLLLDHKAPLDKKDTFGKAFLRIPREKLRQDDRIALLVHDYMANTEDAVGGAPLHIACHGGHEKVVRILLDAEANVDIRDYFGRTPLHIACKRGHAKNVQSLLDKKASVAIKDIFGKTPWDNACNEGRDSVRLLLEQGQYLPLRRTPLRTQASLEALGRMMKVVLNPNRTEKPCENTPRTRSYQRLDRDGDTVMS